jgi:hypothetical protein
MIRLRRTRDAAVLKAQTGPYYVNRTAKLINFYYADGNGRVDFSKQPPDRKLWRSAKDLLKAESHGKCAYCEAPASATSHSDVEHYRPSSKYWWLAYCYDNLVYGCQICNQTYKSDQFLLTGPPLPAPALPAVLPLTKEDRKLLASAFAIDPATLSDQAARTRFIQEHPHLPHPYFDDPETLFAWAVDQTLEEVAMKAANNTAKSLQAFAAAEAMLGINRIELKKLRWIAYDELEALALTFQSGHLAGTQREIDTFKALKRMAEDTRGYAGMRRYFLKK